MAHAYFVIGRAEEGIEAALRFGEKTLGFQKGDRDMLVLRYSLFSVEEARRIGELVSRAPLGNNGKLIVIAAERLFHESQNALLKVFEEPTEGTTLVLVVPSEGIILPTLRSRLLALPGKQERVLSELAQEFIDKPTRRAKVIELILARAKSDKPEEKQGARQDARELIEGVMRATYETNRETPRPELAALLVDLNALMPVMFDRSAPLKPILEHLTIVVPKNLTNSI